MIVKSIKEYFVGFLGRIKNKGYKVELKEMIKVMQHYDNGGEIIYKVKDDEYCSWTKCNNPIWDWFEFEYRIKKEKVTIEKWLIEENDIKFVVETSDIDSWLKPFPTAQKLKLIESYEVEI